MMIKWIALLPLLLLLVAWAPPETCEPSEREVRGNTNTPCRLVLPEIEAVEHRFTIEYPYCHEEIAFHMLGIGPNERRIRIHAYSQTDLGNQAYGTNTVWGWQHQMITTDYAIYRAENPISSGSTIHTDSVFGYVDKPFINLVFNVPFTDEENRSTYPYDYELRTPTFPVPDTSSRQALANSCLALVAQEKEKREHAAELERREAEAAARARAEADAAQKEEEQALAEAESQARIAKIELQAALEGRIRIAKTEVVRAETLLAQHAHEQVINEIVQDVVRIRLLGEEDRAIITNNYLALIETSTAAFAEEVKEIETRIQAYIDFNASLLDKLDAHWTAIDATIANVRVNLEAQRNRIAELESDLLLVTEDLGNDAQ